MVKYITDNYINIKYEKYDEFNKSKKEYDSAGYGTLKLIEKILLFWKNLSDDYILKIDADELELDLHAGREYIQDKSKIEFLIFNYIHYTLNKKSESSYYEPDFDINFINDIDINNLYQEKVKEDLKTDIHNYNRSIETLIENFKDKEYFKENITKLTELLIK